MSDQNQTLMQKFKALPAGTRTAIVGGAAVVAMFTLGTIYTDDGKGPAKKNGAAQRQSLTVFNPGNGSATEAVAADLEAARKRLQEQEQSIAALKEAARIAQQEGSNTEGRWSEISSLVTQVQALQEQVNSMQSKGSAGDSKTPSGDKQGTALSDALPRLVDGLKKSVTPGGAQPVEADFSQGSTQPGMEQPVPPAQPPKVSIQVVGGEAKPAAAQVRKQAPVAYLPSGANFEAVLLNGMDASTAIGANRSPTPALLRIKTDAILPNMFNFNVRECFALVGGFGNISSERVEMRTETMSCIDEKGEVWEGKVEGYLVGEDGKAGARGRVVSKQGAILAKSFMGSFIGGLGSAFTPQPVQSLNLSGGGQQQYQYPGADQVLGSGISNGLNKSSQALAQFYIKLAEQMFPIVELDAGRKMTIILIKGVELKMEKKQ